MPTPGRRTLQFANLDEVMPEVETLLKGHRTVGNWSLAQILNHLAVVMLRVVDLPASTPRDLTQEVGEERKRQVLESGMLPESLPAPPLLLPGDSLDVHEEVERLRQTIAHYKASGGPQAPHRLFGPLTKDEWNRLQCIHCAHHLSFAVPDGVS